LLYVWHTLQTFSLLLSPNNHAQLLPSQTIIWPDKFILCIKTNCFKEYLIYLLIGFYILTRSHSLHGKNQRLKMDILDVYNQGWWYVCKGYNYIFWGTSKGLIRSFFFACFQNLCQIYKLFIDIKKHYETNRVRLSLIAG
jgi:hypothetical protein